jgi:TRAP-type C4-dicarboxylate transport system permease small subunit
MRIRKTVVNFDVFLASAALVLLLGTIILQVVLRSVFQRPLMGAEEFTRYMVIWVILTPLAYTERENGHIIMEEFQGLLPGALRKIIRFICALCTTAVYLVLTWSVIAVLLNNMNNMTATLKIPFWLFFLPSVIGFAGITVLRIVTHICRLCKKELPWA